MQDSKNRRGRRPIVTVLVSERRLPGGREFVFALALPRVPSRGAPMRATLSARAFAWAGDEAANDAQFVGRTGAPVVGDAPLAAAASFVGDTPILHGAPRDDGALADVLAGLRRVYRTPSRRR